MQKNGYLFVYESLLKQIEYHLLTPGMQLPSEKDLGHDFSVSRMTVRKALARLEEEGKIFRRSGIGTFVKAPAVAGAANSKKLNIGVSAHPEWGTVRSFMTETLSETRKACAEYNCNLLLLSQEELLTGENIDGAFFLFLDPEDFPRASQLAAGKPAVLLNRIIDYPNLSYVAVDYADATMKIIRRMLQNGAKKILFIGGAAHNTLYAQYMRESGYRKAHESLNLPVQESLIVLHDDCHHYRPIAERIESEQPDLIFVSCEYYLPRVYTALEVSGKIGDRNTYVFSFDDTYDCSSFPAGSVSCGRMPFGEMCRRAIQHLSGCVRHEVPNEALHEIFPMSYVINNCPFLI